MASYFYRVNGDESEPVDAVKILAMLENGELYTTSELRCSDESEYKPLSSFPELSACFEGIYKTLKFRKKHASFCLPVFIAGIMPLLFIFLFFMGIKLSSVLPILCFKFILLLIYFLGLLSNVYFALMSDRKSYKEILLIIPVVNLIAGPMLFSRLIDKYKGGLAVWHMKYCIICNICFWLCLGYFEVFFPLFMPVLSATSIPLIVGMIGGCSLLSVMYPICRSCRQEIQEQIERNSFNFQKKFTWSDFIRLRAPVENYRTELWKRFIKQEHKTLRRQLLLLFALIFLLLFYLTAMYLSCCFILENCRKSLGDYGKYLMLPSEYSSRVMPDGPFAKDETAKLKIVRPETYSCHVSFSLANVNENMNTEVRSIQREYLDKNREGLFLFKEALKNPSLDLRDPSFFRNYDSEKFRDEISKVMGFTDIMVMEWYFAGLDGVDRDANAVLSVFDRIRIWLNENPSLYLYVVVHDFRRGVFLTYAMHELSDGQLHAQMEYLKHREEAAAHEIMLAQLDDISSKINAMDDMWGLHYLTAATVSVSRYLPVVLISSSEYFNAAERAKAIDLYIKNNNGLFDRIFAPFFDEAVKASQYYSQSIALARGLRAAVAVELFRRKHGRFPEKLGELVPEFLTSVPVDPFDGKELRYRKGDITVRVYDIVKDEKGKFVSIPADVVKNGFRVYSIGRDLDDDNGRYWTFERDRKSKKCMDYDTGDISATVLLK